MEVACAILLITFMIFFGTLNLKIKVAKGNVNVSPNNKLVNSIDRHGSGNVSPDNKLVKTGKLPCFSEGNYNEDKRKTKPTI